MSEALRKARYSRQTRLAEVGEVGQRRLSSSRARVDAEGLEGWVAARYLAGAGVGELTVRDEAIAAAVRALDARVRVSAELQEERVEAPGSVASGSAPSGSAPSGSAPSGSAPSGSAPWGSAPSRETVLEARAPAEPCAFHDEAAAAVARGALAALRVVREALGGDRA